MTNKLRAAAEQALEALETCDAAHPSDGGQQWYDSKAVEAAITALREALAEQEPVVWKPIATAPNGRIVLVHYKNSLGNGRTMRARYYLPETLDSDTTESGWADEGWYEESEAYEYLMPLDREPTHWRPLPAAPDTAPQPAKPAERKPLTEEQIGAALAAAFPDDAEPDGSWKLAQYERDIFRLAEQAHGIGDDK